MDREKRNLLLNIVIPVIICVLSLTLFRSIFTSSDFAGPYTDYLDDKRTNVMEITAASTAASAAVTMIPGDTGTPIAEKLADLSGYSLIVLCAVFLEKYLVTITGYAAFQWIIPAACIIWVINVLWWKREAASKLALKLALIGVVIFAVIPVSVQTSKLIENTYQDSIEETVESATESSQEIQEKADSDNDSWWDAFVGKLAGGVNEVTQKFQNYLNRFIEAFAVMIVTSCIIPICVFVFFIWLFKLVFHLDFDLPGYRGRHLIHTVRKGEK